MSEPGFYYINGSAGSRIEGIINYNEDVQNPADFPADALRSGPECDSLFFRSPAFEVSPCMTLLFFGAGAIRDRLYRNYKKVILRDTSKGCDGESSF